jgi:hypothetical protein
MFGPIFISAVAFWGLALGGGFYWARRYVRAIEGRSSTRDEIEALEARIRALEAERSERSRIAEGGAPQPRLDAPRANDAP